MRSSRLFDFESVNIYYNRIKDCISLLEDLDQRDLLDMDKVRLLSSAIWMKPLVLLLLGVCH